MSRGDVPTSKADRIYRWILEEFRSGRIALGERLPSENELCALFSVSRPQARLAVARLAHEGLVKTIRGTGTFRLDPRENGRANRDIAVVLPNLDSYIYPEIVAAAGSVLRGNGYQALFDCSDSDIGTEQHILRRLLERRPAGLIFSPLQHSPDEVSPSLPLVEKLRAAGVAVVLVDNTLGDDRCSSLSMDDFGAGLAAAEYLIGRGHRRLAVCWQASHAPFHHRARGFIAGAGKRLPDRDSCAANPAELPIAEVRLASAAEAKSQLAGFADNLEKRADRPSAVFCANDRLALDLRELALSRGLKIPQDVSLMGFDDSPLARLPEIGLTTFAYPSRWIGEKAAEMAIEAVKAAQEGKPGHRTSRVVEPALVERGSVGDGPEAGSSVPGLRN